MDIVKQLRQIRDEDDWKIIVQECLDAADEIERLREEVDELVKERNRYKLVCLQIVRDSKEESDISDFVLYLATDALKESE